MSVSKDSSKPSMCLGAVQMSLGMIQNLIIPSQMEVQQRNVALLDPQGKHRTQTFKEHLKTRKLRKQIKKIKDRRAYAERTVQTLAFAPSALRPLCYVVLNACDQLQNVATRSQNLQQKNAAKQPRVAKQRKNLNGLTFIFQPACFGAGCYIEMATSYHQPHEYELVGG